MFNRIFIIIYLSFSVTFLAYLWPSSVDFPPPPENAVQSGEPADTETSLRRAYFTDLTREEVITHYKNNYKNLVTFNFNYPPEEAQTIIRDQTRSWYLEELVHPFRESLFINGFIPQEDKDKIVSKGVEYYQKITIRHVPSSRITRMSVGIATLVSIFLLAVLIKNIFPKFRNLFINFFKLFI